MATDWLNDIVEHRQFVRLGLIQPDRSGLAVADTLADQVEQHLPDGYQAQLYARLAETGAVEATAAVVAAFPENRLVTILVGDASQIRAPVEALRIGDVKVVTG